MRGSGQWMTAAAAAMTIVAAAPAAEAGGLVGAAGRFVVACENGANYRLDAAATTVFGEVVTGRLHLSPHRAIHVRLIPMGDGYRYAAPGIWLEGFRDQAQLVRQKGAALNCSVGPA